MVLPDRGNKRLRELPALGQPRANVLVSDPEHRDLGLPVAHVLVFDQVQQLGEELWLAEHHGQLAHVVQHTRGEGILRPGHARVPGDHLGDDPDAHAVRPEQVRVEPVTVNLGHPERLDDTG